MQGGGVCSNPITCLAGADSFTFDDFCKATDSTTSGVTKLTAGIWNRNPDSQVSLYNHVYIPYCSGDLHAGDKQTGSNQFKGWSNSKKFFELISGKIITDIETKQVGTPIRKVVLSGFSAGGYGAVLNLPQLQTALRAANRSVQVTLVNDSAPFFNNVDTSGNPQLWSSCLQQALNDRYGYANTFLAARTATGARLCTNCSSASWMAQWQSAVLAANPQVNYAFVSSTDDFVIRAFLTPEVAFSECIGKVPATNETSYLAGLEQIRATLKSTSVETATRHAATYFQSYNAWDALAASTKHVFIHNGTPGAGTAKGSGYFFPYVGTTSVKTWLEGFLSNPARSAVERHVGTCTPAFLAGTFNCN